MPAKTTRYCSACDHSIRGEFRPGPRGRRDAKCPRCKSLERQRFLALLLDTLRPSLGDVGTLLDIAPTPGVTRFLRELEPERYVRLDIGYDNRLRDVTASVTHLPFASGSVDLLICFHVLEHVPEDTRAMRELARVLAPGGLGIIQVPWKPSRPTEEDLEADVDERIRRFGQHDHVRMYGEDFEQILMAQGLSVHRVNPRAMFGARAVAWLRLNPEVNNIWIVQPAGAPALSPRADPLQTRMSRMLDTMLGALANESAAADRQRERVRREREQVRRLRKRIDVLRQENKALQQDVERIRQHWAVKAARKGKAVARSVTGSVTRRGA